MKKLFELYWAFFKVGGLTFGGGLAMLPMLNREIVNHYHWATEEELLDYYAIGQCTPGIIAVNTATFVGFKQKRWLGAAFATAGVVSPSLIIISLIAAILARFIDNPFVMHALAGIRVAVSAMLLHTVLSMIQKGVKDRIGIALFLMGLVLSLFTPLPIILIVLLAAAIGIIVSRRKEAAA